MTESVHDLNKALVNRLRGALYDIDPSALRGELRAVFAPDAEIRLAFPFGDLDGPDALCDVVYRPLLAAVPDLERRDFIAMAGECRGAKWVGCGGNYPRGPGA